MESPRRRAYSCCLFLGVFVILTLLNWDADECALAVHRVPR